jgi:hypothetical protein
MTKSSHIHFTHRQSAHCESGVAVNLMNHYGLDISEAMAFGIGGGLFFAYLPFVKVNLSCGGRAFAQAYLPPSRFRVDPTQLFLRGGGNGGA